MSCDATSTLARLQAKAAETHDRDALAAELVEALCDELPQASWVGIYWLLGQELVLGPFKGPATEHTRIPVGTGVCGTAVATDEDQLISDVREVENYLSCNANVRSELVALIRSHDGIVGQIDMDANEVDAFDEDALCVVRAIADGFGGLLAAMPAAPIEHPEPPQPE